MSNVVDENILKSDKIHWLHCNIMVFYIQEKDNRRIKMSNKEEINKLREKLNESIEKNEDC